MYQQRIIALFAFLALCFLQTQASAISSRPDTSLYRLFLSHWEDSDKTFQYKTGEHIELLLHDDRRIRGSLTGVTGDSMKIDSSWFEIDQVKKISRPNTLQTRSQVNTLIGATTAAGVLLLIGLAVIAIILISVVALFGGFLVLLLISALNDPSSVSGSGGSAGNGNGILYGIFILGFLFMAFITPIFIAGKRYGQKREKVELETRQSA